MKKRFNTICWLAFLYAQPFALWAQVGSATNPTSPAADAGTLGGTSEGLYAQIETIIGLTLFIGVFLGLYLFIRNKPAEHGKKRRR